jgi:hypothetical protein
MVMTSAEARLHWRQRLRVFFPLARLRPLNPAQTNQTANMLKGVYARNLSTFMKQSQATSQ